MRLSIQLVSYSSHRPKIGCTPETLRSWHKKHIDQIIPGSV
ncbi:hypothetical protein QL919_06730 [Psychrobacter sp. APC 3426]|nr:hypothetical protein [Psychrobacter sp. APC 3426]MDN3398421.1 hypothetical protein [Psychrobacter sp. APC 3426]